ncbi:MAG: tetratricopeptide repeat protein, partial [Cyanothece sp. SIO2G6]|nr:tetratricopeptide repeat protein [Cyanothece sp. SIO2G6]
QGDRATKTNNGEQVYTSYQQALQLAPQSSVPHEKLAQGLEQRGQKDHDLAQVLENEVLARAYQQVETFYGDKKWTEAIAQAQTLIQRWPTHAPTYKLLGNALYQQGQMEAAQAAYENALIHQPDFAEVHVNLGNVTARLEAWDEAIAHYQNAIALKPDFAGAYRNLARVWSQVGNERLAVACQFQAAELEPDSLAGLGYLTLGHRLAEQGQTQGAIACYHQILVALQSGDRRAYHTNPFFAGFLPEHEVMLHQRLAEVLTTESQWQEAVAHYQRANALQQQWAESSGLTTVGHGFLTVGSAPSTGALATTKGMAIAPSWYQRVQQLAEQEQWQQVAQVLGAGLQQIEPDLAQLYELMAKSLRLTQQPDASITYYQKMAVLQPQDAKPFANLGSLYAQRQQWQEAIRSFQQAIERDPEFAGAYRNLARVWQNVGDEQAATECWLKSYELEPDWGTATNRLEMGQRLAQQGRIEDAIATYETAIALDPTLVMAHWQLATLYQQQGQAEPAVAAYGKVLTLQPDHGDAAYELGCLLAQHQQLDRAIACFKKLVNLEPEYLRGHIQLRDLLLGQDQPEQALPHCQQVAEARLDNAEDQYKWGATLAQMQQWEAAIAPLQRSTDLGNTTAPVLDCLGAVLMNLARWSEAEPVLRQAVEADPNYPWAHHNLGNTLAKLGQPEAAIASLERAIALNPQFGRTYESLAGILAQLEQWDEALATYRQGRNVDPASESVTNNIIHLLYRQIESTPLHSPQRAQIYQVLADEWIMAGNQAQAIAAYQTALHINPDQRSVALALAQLLLSTQPQSAQTLLDWALHPGYASSLKVTDISQLQDIKRVKALLTMSHLFDPQYYQRRYQLEGLTDLLDHYLTVGWQQGYQPNPLFDPAYYNQQNPDVAAMGVDPLVHYLTLGYQQGCHPHPLFRNDFYWEQHEDVAIAQTCPLEHYLAFGTKEGRVGFAPEQCIAWLESPVDQNADYLALTSLQPSTPPQPSPYQGEGGGASPLSKWGLRGVIGVYCNSLGNYFIAEIADFIAVALIQAGHQVQRLTELDEPPANLNHHVIVAPHEFFYLGEGLHRAEQLDWWSTAVMVNVEQPQTQWFSRAFHFLRRSPQIFDISVTSAAMLRSMGLETYWLPLGYLENYAPFSSTQALPDLLAVRGLNPAIRQTCPALDAPLSDRPLDLHFVGTLSRRRELFFARNARWLSQYRCFWHIPPIDDPLVKGKGQALDTDTAVGLSRRSKILLNLHRDEYPYFEWHRMVFFGLWQNTLVLTEPCHEVPGLEANVHYIACPMEEMEAKVHWLLQTVAGRAEAEQVRQAGHAAIKSMMPAREMMQRMVAIMDLPLPSSPLGKGGVSPLGKEGLRGVISFEQQRF